MKVAPTSMKVRIGNVSKTDLVLRGTTVGSKAAEMDGQLIKSCSQWISQSVSSILYIDFSLSPQFTLVHTSFFTNNCASNRHCQQVVESPPFLPVIVKSAASPARWRPEASLRPKSSERSGCFSKDSRKKQFNHKKALDSPRLNIYLSRTKQEGNAMQ